MPIGTAISSHFSDETIRGLRATVDEHPNDALGKQALESLGAIRDDRALRHVHAIAMRTTGKIGKRAAQILGDVARSLGVTMGELEDRVVPELGLDEHGSMTLDYGSRRFTVGFDEQLDPFVRDEGGDRLRAMPHAASGDDPEKAAHAAAVWKQLKADVRVVGREQVQRLERAMCEERQWTVEGLATHLVSHRLVGHLARRLVCAVHKLGTTFRVAEDGTYDDGERPVTLASDARIVIAHPVTLDRAARDRWRQVFVEYQVVQPFPQLDREVPSLPAADLDRELTTTFSGRKVHAKSFWGLKHRGWTLAYEVTKTIARWHAKLHVDPPLAWYGRPEDTVHELGSLAVSTKFGALPPILRAELLRDVDLLK